MTAQDLIDKLQALSPEEKTYTVTYSEIELGFIPIDDVRIEVLDSIDVKIMGTNKIICIS